MMIADKALGGAEHAVLGSVFTPTQKRWTWPSLTQFVPMRCRMPAATSLRAGVRVGVYHGHFSPKQGSESDRAQNPDALFGFIGTNSAARTWGWCAHACTWNGGMTVRRFWAITREILGCVRGPDSAIHYSGAGSLNCCSSSFLPSRRTFINGFFKELHPPHF